MEPIGQKVVIPSSDEGLVASDLVDNSLENIETKIFDETLDGALEELHVEEKMINQSENEESIADLKSGNSVLESANLAKNNVVSEIDINTDTLKKSSSNIALEVMEEVLLSEGLSSEKIQNIEEKENLLPEIVEEQATSYTKSEFNLDSFEENIDGFRSNSEVSEKSNSFPKEQLQTYVHYANPVKEGSDDLKKDKEIFVNKVKNEDVDFGSSKSELFNVSPMTSDTLDLETDLPENNLNESVQKVEDYKNSTTNIGHRESKILNSLEIIDDESSVSNIQSEDGLNKELVDKFFVKDEKNIVSNLKSALDKEEVNLNEDLKIVANKEVEDRQIDNQKFGLGEMEEDRSSNANKGELNNNISNLKSLEGKEKYKTSEDFQFVNSKITEDQEIFRKEKGFEIAMNGTKVFEVAEGQKVKSKDEIFTVNNIEQNPKVLDDQKTKFRGDLFVGDKGKVKMEFTEDQKFLAKEKLNEVLIPKSEKMEFTEDQKFLAKEKLNEVLIPKLEKMEFTEDQKVLTKEKNYSQINNPEKAKFFNSNQSILTAKEINNFKDVDSFAEEQPITELNKIESGIKMTVKEGNNVFSEKLSIDLQNNTRSLVSNIDNVSTKIKDTSESTSSFNSSIVNSIADSLNVSNLKIGESSNISGDNFRNSELPFNIEQVVSRVRILRGNGVEEMTLRLHPEELGQITLKIRQSGTDLTIDMRVDNLQAKQLIESGFDFLRNRFLDNDFSFQELALNVDINEQDSQFDREKKNSEFLDDLTASERSENKEDEEELEKPLVGEQSDSGLNLYV